MKTVTRLIEIPKNSVIANGFVGLTIMIHFA